MTYAEAGLTRTGERPPGYRHLRHRTLIGSGPVVLARAGEAILTFAMHRALPVKVRAGARRAAPGVPVTVHLGPLRAPCAVVWTDEGPGRFGFGYGTLPGHPAVGEEAFTVERDADDRVWFTVTAFSRPAGPLMRLAGPGAVLFQRWYARACARALRRLSTVVE